MTTMRMHVDLYGARASGALDGAFSADHWWRDIPMILRALVERYNRTRHRAARAFLLSTLSRASYACEIDGAFHVGAYSGPLPDRVELEIRGEP